MSMHSYSAESIMNTFWEYKEAGHLDPSLEAFRSLDHDRTVVDHALDSDSYYYPNIRNGRITPPDAAHEGAIPVVALEENRSYSFGLPGVHELQRIALLGAGVSQSDISAIDGLVGTPLVVAPNGGGYGKVRSGAIEAIVGDERVVAQTTPMLIFNASHPGRQEDQFIGTTLHELVHVAQLLERPLDSYSDRKSIAGRELEAYHVAAGLVRNYRVPYTDSIMTAGTIEGFRQKYMPDSFNPTDEFMYLAEHDEQVGQIIRPLE